MAKRPRATARRFLAGQAVDSLRPDELALLRELDRRGLLEEVFEPRGSVAEWSPFEGPQTAAFYSEADELFYGGAAGGGKSDLLLGLALRAHTTSIIFRREYPQLKGLERRAAEIYRREGGEYNRSSKVWTFPSGKLIEFGAVQHAEDVEKYQGRPHDLKGFDELTHFVRAQYVFLIGWNRTSIRGQRTRIVSTGNPPISAEGRWVIDYWAPWLDPRHPNPALPGELRWFATIDDEEVEFTSGEAFDHDGEIIRPKSRTFIAASIDDNPVLVATDYKSRLQGLPEPLRSLLLEGRFDKAQEDHPWQVIPTEWVLAAQRRWEERRLTGDSFLDAVGIDVARGGKDRTIFAPKEGSYFYSLVEFPGSATPDGQSVALKLALLPGVRPSTRMQVDVIGVGSSAYDFIRENGFAAFSINGSERSDAKDRTNAFGFFNLRSEMYWKMREALDPDTGEDLALPNDPELLADLTAPRYQQVARGIKVESKPDIIERLGRSPDKGDAVVYANARPFRSGEGLAEFYREAAGG